MNIVQIHSGLGNQMFQYAFLLALRERHPDTKADISYYRHRHSHNGFELDRVFGIQETYATPQECHRLADVSKAFWPDLRRKLGFVQQREGTVINEPDPANGISLDVLDNDNGYFIGYWQSERYFADIADKVRNAFTFRLPLTISADAKRTQITSCNSVSIHIRRTDYLKSRRIDDYNVCTADYYERAIAYMQARVPGCRFFIFSDDYDWVKSNMEFPVGTVFVHGFTGLNAWQDLYLMSLCRHNIIANSSFSWWAAWLNNNPDKIVIAPTQWFRHRPRPDIVPEQWIRL